MKAEPFKKAVTEMKKHLVPFLKIEEPAAAPADKKK